VLTPLKGDTGRLLEFLRRGGDRHNRTDEELLAKAMHQEAQSTSPLHKSSLVR